MASAAVVTSQAHGLATPSSTYNGALPASLVAGNLLLAYLAVETRDANPVTFPAGWTTFLDSIAAGGTRRDIWAWKAVTGSEGATVLITNGTTSSRMTLLTWQISDAATPTVQPPEVSTPATGNSNSWNATAVVPTGGSKDYLFICAHSGIPATSTTVPTNYGNRTTSGSGVAGASGCYRQATTASEDPGGWALSPSGVWLATVVAVHPVSLVPKVVTIVAARTTSTPLPITRPRRRLLGLTQTTSTPLPITVVTGAHPGLATLSETWTGPNGELVQADYAWQNVQGGTRWRLLNGKAAFIGSAFGAESLRCAVRMLGETYTIRVPIHRFRRLSANDVSLGLIVRKDLSVDQTFYAIFLQQSAGQELIQLWRYMQGQAPVQLQTAPVTVVEGESLEVRVNELALPDTQLIVRFGGVGYLNIIDPAIPHGRAFGVHGYLQGGTGDTDLQLGTLVATMDPEAPPETPKEPGPGGYAWQRRRRRRR